MLGNLQGAFCSIQTSETGETSETIATSETSETSEPARFAVLLCTPHPVLVPKESQHPPGSAPKAPPNPLKISLIETLTGQFVP